MLTRTVSLTLLAGAALLSAGSVANAQYSPFDYSNGIRDAAAKARADGYYFYRQEAVREEGPWYTTPLAPPAQAAGQRSFSRSPAATNAAVVTDQRLMQAPMLSIGVIRSHASEIRSDLLAANQTYANLSNQYRNNSAAEKYLKREHEHRQAALAAVDKLRAESQNGRAGSRAADADARTVQAELAAASGDHSRFMQSIETTPANSAR